MRIKELREEKGLSQSALASEINTSQRNIGRWENGENEPTYSQLIKLSDFFECSIDYLIGREDDFGNIVLSNVNKTLSNDEQKLVSFFRSLSDDEKQKLMLDAEFYSNKNK